MPADIPLQPICAAAGIAVIAAVAARAAGVLTLPAAAAAAVMLVLAALFWGWTGLGIYASLFLASALLGLIGRKKRAEREEKVLARHGARNIKQVLVNGLPALIAMGAGFFSGIGAFHAAAAASLAAGFADSAASDIGILTDSRTVSIVTFKEVAKGVSGGVSLLGSAAGIFAAAAGAALPLAFGEYSWQIFLSVTAAAILGVALDSVLGGTMQALYRCPVCGAESEKRMCCGENSVVVRGFRHIDNDAVNLIANCSALILGGGAAALITYL